MITPRHRAALAYADAGIPVFPCKVDAKEPAFAGSFHDATVDPDQINDWWSEDDYNIAIYPEGAGWCVIDLDGKDGKESLDQYGLDTLATYSVRTPSGGLHLYFTGSLPSRVRALPGVDVRGMGGYVLAPPSYVIEDRKGYRGPYIVESNVEIAELPGWLRALMTATRAKPDAHAPNVELDLAINVERATEALRGYVARNDVAIEGQGGHDRTYRLACQLRDMGLSEDRAVELIDELWNPACFPPWDGDELAGIVDHAFKYGQNAPGVTAWANAIPPAWEATVKANPSPPAPPAPQWPPIYTGAQLSGMIFPAPQWVWKDRLLAFEPNLYTGDAGTGKTTLAEHIAVAAAAGVPLLGHATMKATTLLLVAEDAYGPVRDNLLAIRAALDAPTEALEAVHVLSIKSARIPGGHLLATIADDGSWSDTAFMRYVVQHLQAITGPALLVIDPLEEFVRFDRYKDTPPRALATSFLANICEINGGRTTVLVNDHPSKASMDAGHHYAGSTQLKAAFSLFATLKAAAWSGSKDRQRELTFSVIKGRYTGEQDTKFLRTSRSQAFVLAGPKHKPDDHQVAIYKHVVARIGASERTTRENRGGHGPAEIAYTLEMDEKAVKSALTALVAREWLKSEAGALALGTKAPALDGY